MLKLSKLIEKNYYITTLKLDYVKLDVRQTLRKLFEF